ncbi:MAG: ABC transporter permease [Deltaproteobacteria bacterium]|jgi:phospholipid/cholesterol/gamma-HCH transport system permease protein|nr:ABC transporter permease [Deltaproteobacteria bacterium]
MADERSPDSLKTAQQRGANAPFFSVHPGRDGVLVRVGGDWSALTLGLVERAFLAEVVPLGGSVAIVDLMEVTRLDTAGALLLKKAVDGGGARFAAADERHGRLLRFVDDAGGLPPPFAPPPSPLARFVNDLGKSIVEESHLAVKLVAFLGEYLVTVGRILLRPKLLPLTSLVSHMQQVGVAAVPIVALLSFLIGLVIAHMGAQQLGRFGMDIFVVNLVEIATLRELGVLLSSIVIAGRSGSSFTAQIGAMVANEEVAAMRTMGLSPMVRLAFPRITALVIMLPALVFLADVMGLLGGSLAVWTLMDMSPAAYVARMQETVRTANFVVGMVKAPFFAAVIGVIGCFQGFQVTGSAESVGRLTTHAVVESIFMVIVLDALFAIFFMGLRV